MTERPAGRVLRTPARLSVLAASFLGVGLLPAAADTARSCGGEPGWASAEVSASVRRGETFRHDSVAWTFVLRPTDFGWRIDMRDPSGEPIPVFAPPLRPVDSNPLNIAGWHFRNRDNTGPNTGDINAPQHLRRFTFGRLAADPLADPQPTGPEGLGGLGEVVLGDMTLTPPHPGQRAAITAMDFSVCLVWEGGGDRLAPIVSADPGVGFETATSAMIGCGLDAETYDLSDRMSESGTGLHPSYLEPDLDGDNIPDLVVPVTRKTDHSPGLAICLLGDETLIMAGFDGWIGRHLDPEYFGRADGWAIHRGPVFQGAEEAAPPVLVGDGIALWKDESSSVLIYLDRARRLSSYWQGD